VPLGARYRVETVFDVDGAQARREAERTADKIEEMDRRAQRARSSLKRMLAIGGGLAAGGLALGAGVAGARMLQLSHNAEKARIQIAGTFQVLSKEANSFEQNLRKADNLFKRFSERSITSPATRQKFTQLFQSAAPAVAGLGLSNEQIAQFTQRSVGAAVAFTGSDYEQAGRDIRMILGGRARANVKTFAGLKNPLLEQMGASTTKEFNKMVEANPAKGFRVLNDVLSETDPMLDRFANSLGGLTATATEFINRFLLTAGDAFAKGITDELELFIGWFRDNRGTIEETAEALGQDLGDAVRSVGAWARWTKDHLDSLAATSLLLGGAGVVRSARSGALRSAGAMVATSGIGRGASKLYSAARGGPGIGARLKGVGGKALGAAKKGGRAGLLGLLSVGGRAIGLGSLGSTAAAGCSRRPRRAYRLCRPSSPR